MLLPLLLALACAPPAGEARARPRPGDHGGDETGDSGDSGETGDTGGEPEVECAPGVAMAFDPAAVEAGEPLTVAVTGEEGYVYVGLDADGPAEATVTWAGVTGEGPYTWTWVVTELVEGAWSFTFSADSGATVLCTASLDVLPGDGEEGGGISASGTGFVKDGAPYRFVGFNTRGIAHYGGGDILPYTSAADVGLALDAARAAGGTVVRAFVANQHVDDAVSAGRLADLLDAAEARGISVIAALTDYYPTGFCPAGDEDDYYVDPNGYTVLTHEWFAGGYERDYLPFTRAVVARNAGHPALFAWELGNEVKDPWYPDTFVAFVDAMAGTIRSLDPETMVTAGLISTGSAALDSADAAAVAGDLDFLTVHLYEGATDADLALAESLGMPIVVEEAGFSGSDRAGAVSAHASATFTAGSDGYMQWGLMASEGDNGDGDRTYGMDRVFHDDWDALTAGYAAIAAGL